MEKPLLASPVFGPPLPERLVNVQQINEFRKENKEMGEEQVGNGALAADNNDAGRTRMAAYIPIPTGLVISVEDRTKSQMAETLGIWIIW